MNFKYQTILSLISVLILSFIMTSTTQSNSKIESIDLATLTMCADLTGRCTGSAYCTACSNCSRCGYCNSGGSCGVCGKRPKIYYAKKRKHKKTNEKINFSKITSKSSYNNKSSSKPTLLTEDIYVLIQRTSLREYAHSSAKVLRRLAINDRVQILDEYSQKYWCKVLHRGKLGWVKKHLLEKRKSLVHP